MLYTLSEFMTKLKEDIGIKDIPLPVDDESIINRFASSSLKEFSVRCPVIEEFVLPSNCAVEMQSLSMNGSVVYKIPKEVIQDRQIIQILGIDTGRSGGSGDYYVPTAIFGSPEVILETISDIKLAAQLGSMMAHAPTFRFTPPDRLRIYNGWFGGSFYVEASFTHDLSLSTIPPTAFTHLFQLAQLDIQSYLYNKLKRKNNLDLGIGTSNLNIDSWEDSASRMADLLKSWDDDGACLDQERITRW